MTLAGVLVAGLMPAMPAVPAGAATAGPEAAQVDWGVCPADRLKNVPPDQVKYYSCALYRVPIDHDNAALGTIDIALLKRAARGPGQRIGSLFVNPGGPGGSGLTMPPSAERFLRPEVIDRFDLIGFDPRGVGASNQLHCFTTQEDAEQVHGEVTPVPLTQAQISSTLAGYRDYGQFCKNNAGTLLDHMSTKDVVRDLDQLRAAVGEQKLNYVGFSYGTLIGATYAAMFPRQTRAIVMDGNVDPALRTGDGVEYDRERGQGIELSLEALLTRCRQAGPKCAFGSGDPRAKFDELRDHLREQPITLPGATEPVDIDSFTLSVADSLYSPSSFPELTRELQALYDVIHPPASQSQAAGVVPLQVIGKGGNGLVDLAPDTPYTGGDATFAVDCSDKPFRIDQSQVPEIAARAEAESPTFGRAQTFSETAVCPVWPVKDPDTYRGPWQLATDVPVLVISNFYDPATRYQFGQRSVAELGNARLLSVDSFGHTILGRAAGVDKAAADYLTDLTVPAAGQVFEPDSQPFT